MIHRILSWCVSNVSVKALRLKNVNVNQRTNGPVNAHLTIGLKTTTMTKEGRALSPFFFAPPRKPKIESYCITSALGCFIR